MSPRRRLLVAIVTGVVLAGPPVAALKLWLDDLVERRVQAELHAAAEHAIALAENRIERAEATLNELAVRGIDSCQPADVEALRQATFATPPIKELSIVGSEGRTLCNDAGNAPEIRTVLSAEPLTSAGSPWLELIRLGQLPALWVGIHKRGAGGAHGMAAVIPAELFLPHASDQGQRSGLHVRLATRNGALIAEVGEKPTDGVIGDRLVVASRTSDRYGLSATVTGSEQVLASGHGDLRSMGIVASGLIVILILAVAVLLPRRERINPIAEIERALEQGEFIPYYQPIVDIRSGRLRGAEVLVRWRKPDGTLMPPAAFIPLAESSGLVLELTRRLMRSVSEDMGPIAGPRRHLKISFNLTARHFANEEIVDDIRHIFKKSAIRTSQIVLEVTERQPLENLTETRRVVAALQGLGVRIAIDDVGSGHNGLSYVLKLGADIIKIDKMFIDSVGIDRHSNTIIEMLIDLAQNMRMDVVAEGVETFEQVVQLRELGIRAAQGYVFAPPLPSAAFKQLVAALDPLKRTHDGVVGSETGSTREDAA